MRLDHKEDQHARRGVSPMRARTAFGDVWEGFLAGWNGWNQASSMGLLRFCAQLLRELCEIQQPFSHSGLLVRQGEYAGGSRLRLLRQDALTRRLG